MGQDRSKYTYGHVSHVFYHKYSQRKKGHWSRARGRAGQNTTNPSFVQDKCARRRRCRRHEYATIIFAASECTLCTNCCEGHIDHIKTCYPFPWAYCDVSTRAARCTLITLFCLLLDSLEGQCSPSRHPDHRSVETKLMKMQVLHNMPFIQRRHNRNDNVKWPSMSRARTRKNGPPHQLYSSQCGSLLPSEANTPAQQLRRRRQHNGPLVIGLSGLHMVIRIRPSAIGLRPLFLDRRHPSIEVGSANQGQVLILALLNTIACSDMRCIPTCGRMRHGYILTCVHMHCILTCGRMHCLKLLPRETLVNQGGGGEHLVCSRNRRGGDNYQKQSALSASTPGGHFCDTHKRSINLKHNISVTEQPTTDQ